MTKYHPREFDLSTKELFQSLELPLLQYVIGKPVQLLKALNVGFVRIENRDADMIYEAIVDQQPAIVHLEVQSSNDKTMLSRMLRYLAEIYAAHQLPVYQCVVYLGKEPVAMQSELAFALDVGSKIEYCYRILALNQLPFESVAKLEPIDFLTLLPLTHSELDAEQHLNQSIQVVTERSQGLDFNRRSNLLLKTEIFAGLRFEPALIERVFEEVMTMFQIEESPLCQASCQVT